MKPSSLWFAIAVLVSLSACSRTELSAGGDLDLAPTPLDDFPCADAPLDSLGSLSVEGSTVGQGNELTGSCGGDSAPDVAFVWTAPTTDTWEISTSGSTFDTILYVFEGGCDADELACNDDVGDDVLTSRVIVSIDRGTTLVIGVDGFDDESGTFRMIIRPVS
jgi:hypothetical protein